ncbi:acyl-CoA dehydrogenase family protein [Kitasatospora sp. NPDC092286]|uniref:acyl-CoA dehydrogenase family protein n=1 Tax=Kitasatospora sp. NPDC092286 TaxID=3364087 RepID=UPI0037F61B31
MDFDLTAEQQKRFDDLRDALISASPEPDGSGAPYDRDRWQKVARLGLTGLCLPTEYGGGGLDALDTALGLEAFGEGYADTGLVFAVSAHLLACAVPIRDFAGDDVRAELLPGLASGALIAANAMTEDEAGSDLRTPSVTARRDGDHYVLHGEKSFASNAPAADVIVTYAVTDPGAGFLGLSGFAVPRNLPGIHVSEPFTKMGLSSCPAGRVRFDGCAVPARYLLGREGQGTAVFTHSMQWERTCLFAGYLGMMNRQLARCAEQARERRQFSKAIGSFQAVSHRIASMKQRLEAARLLLYRAAWLLARDRPDTTAIALAKLAVSEAAVANSLDAIQVFGGSGYLAGTGVERNLRDAVPSTLFSGTSEIQRNLVAQSLGL